jgi:hypothetical protein
VTQQVKDEDVAGGGNAAAALGDDPFASAGHVGEGGAQLIQRPSAVGGRVDQFHRRHVRRSGDVAGPCVVLNLASMLGSVEGVHQTGLSAVDGGVDRTSG